MKRHDTAIAVSIQPACRFATRAFIASAGSVVLAVCSGLAIAATPSADRAHGAHIVTAWNKALLSAAEKQDKFLTLKGVRTAAMAHIAMAQTANRLTAAATIDKAGKVTKSEANSGPSAIAAATHAAYTIVAAQYPEQLSQWQALNKRWLSTVKSEAAKVAGIAVGQRAADAVLKSRAGDGWNAEADYQWHPMAPGVYAEFKEHSGTPEGFIFGAGWANAKGFALEKPDQFRSPPPPDIKSQAYVEAYQEVRELGRHNSATRTKDQTHLAMWWKDFAENSLNRLARDLTEQEQLGLPRASRLFAMLNMSIFDAYVSVFNNKFHYNHWRPYTAIRWAENDGNPATEAEPDWTNTHQHTYAFPSYPSAHGTACTAGMTVFADVLGDDFEFVMRTPQVDAAGPFSKKVAMDPPTRKFSNFAQAARECAYSRIYLGIHFRYDSDAGLALGKQVGEQVLASDRWVLAGQ